MPTVPTEQNRIGLASASGEKLHPGDYRDTGLEALGTGLSQLGGSGMAVAQEAHRRFVVDDTAVKSAWNGYSRASRAVLDGLQRDTGDPGASGAATQQMLGELRGQVLAGLGNDRQRALAARSIDERLGIDALKIQGIVDGKRAAARERETDQLRETSADDAVAHAEDHMLSEKFAQTGEGTFGTAPEALHYRSGINLRIADARTRSDPLAAKAWLERNRETMTPEDIATAEQGLAAPLADLRAVADADAPLLARAPLAPVTPPMGELEAKMRTITPQGLSDGKDGLSSLVQRYKGDAAKAWGAMLLGADTLDATIAREGDGWFASLPDNERGFIAENMALLGATASPRAAASPGQGEEQRNWIEAQPWNEERKARALDELEQRDAREAQRRTQAASAAKDAAYALTDQLGSGFTSIAQLPPEMRRALDDETQAALTRQAKANAKPVPVVSQGTTAHDLTKLAATDRQGFVNTDLRLHRDQVTPEEYDALVTAQQGWRASPPAIPAVMGQRAWEKITQFHAIAAVEDGKPFVTTKPGALTVGRAAHAAVDKVVETIFREEGGLPPAQSRSSQLVAKSLLSKGLITAQDIAEAKKAMDFATANGAASQADQAFLNALEHRVALRNGYETHFSPQRTLRPSEIGVIKRALPPGTDLPSVRIVKGSGGSALAAMAFAHGNPAITIGNTIYIEKKWYQSDLTSSPEGVRMLVHELNHVRQYDRYGKYHVFGRILKEGATIGADDAYRYYNRPIGVYDSEALEAQSQIAGDYAMYMERGVLPEYVRNGKRYQVTVQQLKNYAKGSGIYGN